MKEQAGEELKKLGIALISLRKKRFANAPGKKELIGFSDDKNVILNSLLILLSHGNAVDIPKGYLEEVATLMNQAGVAALNMVRKVWNKVEHPSKGDWDTYIGWTSNIALVFKQAINTSDEDDEEDITRYKNLIIAIEEPIGSCSWKRKWDSYANEYIWFEEYSLSESAIAAREEEVQKCKDKIAQLEKKIGEKKDAEAKKAAEEKKAKVPSEDESDKLEEQIGELQKRRAGLGIFAGKEKKQIGEEIASLQGRIPRRATMFFIM